LSGGGARGAYEAGVLDYIFNTLSKDVELGTKIDVFCGTSVGAIHAAYLASRAEQADYDVAGLCAWWGSNQVQDVLRLDLRQAISAPWDLWQLFRSPHSKGVLVNNRVFKQAVGEHIAWPQITKNMANGQVAALAVSTTHIRSGRTVIFVQEKDGQLPRWSRDKRRVAQATTLGPEHVLASASIPFLFPPVKIDGGYFTDGCLRQNTPLSPALRLGADKVLVIGTAQAQSTLDASQSLRDAEAPGVLAVLGKAVDALMLDRLEYDLARLNGFNEILKDGHAIFGEEFGPKLNEMVTRIRGVPYRSVDVVCVRPSQDIGACAANYIEANKLKLGGPLGWLLSKVTHPRALEQTDLGSYLLFDGPFAHELMQMGRDDAHAMADTLANFFTQA
ncbi:MAG: patatin-like phospholipase family protein, partial [Myxococcota bacterium]|nr:patatin-like phospholipase family protein [Myxococcota bacterium]